MEPRELWERHAVLAQAFCSSDDEVRRTQGLLDEAEARRSRTLAAFAVTVGSDAVVAELLGLEEREVRLARRTVGKEDARAVAQSLLAQAPREQPPAQQAAAHPATPPAQPTPSTPLATHHTAPATAAPAPAPQLTEPAWAPALDAVLMSSWHNGVDLTALATELGLDVRLLVARAQQLSAESRPAQQAPPDRTGRHRRMGNVPPSPPAESTHLAWRERPPQVPREPYEQEPWKQQPYQNYPDQQEYQDYRVYEEHPQQHQHPGHHPHQHQHHAPHQQYQQPPHPTWDANAITAAQHDWDGILSQWEATTSTTPPLSAPGQGGV